MGCIFFLVFFLLLNVLNIYLDLVYNGFIWGQGRFPIMKQPLPISHRGWHRADIPYNIFNITWVRVSHVAKRATLASQWGYKEPCKVGQSPHKASLLRVVSVKDTVVDDVILKPSYLIDVLSTNW